MSVADALTQTQTLEGLHDGIRQQSILNRILELAIPLRWNARPEEPHSSPRSKAAQAPEAPKIHAAPYPGTGRTLARPFTKLSGRRHIPILVNANKVPFLRLTKPQSPFLSRIIRDTVEKRERRILIADRLAGEIPIAKDEDVWDRILYEHFALNFRDPLEQPWEREVKRAFDDNHKMQVDAIQKRADMSARMSAIVEQEKTLVIEEKLRIRDEKHKKIKARRLARRGWTESEIQEKLYPPVQKTVIHDAPTTIDEVPEQSRGEVRRPDTEQKSRRRGDKYQTPEELKQLYEASLRPKTEEEIAKIKEARATRKEEESERKAQKLKRKQEKAAFESHKFKEAEGSAYNRVGMGTQGELDSQAASPTPPFARVVRRMDYGSIQRQPEMSPLPTASGLVSDARSSWVESGAQNLGVVRPSLFKHNSKNP